MYITAIDVASSLALNKIDSIKRDEIDILQAPQSGFASELSKFLNITALPTFW